MVSSLGRWPALGAGLVEDSLDGLAHFGRLGPAEARRTTYATAYCSSTRFAPATLDLPTGVIA
jgi:hypothetical protein